ncbi:MAG TPA: divergent polysaccharide deacetylase family protein [Rhizomicrobium sp.]|nr:divergent polysaccharide deacetylase family protein [Rhizomicrobium sp.]
MADTAFTEDERAPRAARALGLATAIVFCLLTAGALGITLLGTVTPPVVVLDLSFLPAAKPAPPQNIPADITAPPVVVDKPLFAGKALVADPALIENSPVGPLPRIADDGRKPMTVYAAPAAAGKFRIAIVVSGLGISAKATTAALASLPPGVTMGFAPYAGDVQHWVNEARQSGHEVLLEVPMEPFDFPDSDPGPYTLRAGVDEDSNLQRLTWTLSRFTGYAGVTNLLGQRFLSNPDALSPALTYMARRGLYFYDNGASAGSAAPQAAGATATPFARSNESLDGIQTALEIDRHLSALEDQARAHGSAIGSGFLYPVTLDRIAAWSKGLQGRGFVLVPVSAIVTGPSK